jgi:hypothetical protein
MKTTMVLVVAALAVLPQASAAQAPAAPAAAAPAVAVQKMQALAFLVGEWEGEAWMQMGPDRRETVRQHERVELEVGGEVLTIRGQGHVGDRLVHDAVASIVWDPAAQRYDMWTYRAGGGPSDPSIEVGERQVVWGFETPRGKIRFTIRLDEQGRWSETGERSDDGGATWQTFFGMTLAKK